MRLPLMHEDNLNPPHAGPHLSRFERFVKVLKPFLVFTNLVALIAVAVIVARSNSMIAEFNTQYGGLHDSLNDVESKLALLQNQAATLQDLNNNYQNWTRDMFNAFTSSTQTIDQFFADTANITINIVNGVVPTQPTHNTSIWINMVPDGYDGRSYSLLYYSRNVTTCGLVFQVNSGGTQGLSLTDCGMQYCSNPYFCGPYATGLHQCSGIPLTLNQTRLLRITMIGTFTSWPFGFVQLLFE